MPVAAEPSGEDRPAGDGDGNKPGRLEQALTLTEAQMTGLNGVEDAWRAAGNALAGIGRRRRRRER